MAKGSKLGLGHMLACVNHVYIWKSRPIKCYVHAITCDWAPTNLIPWTISCAKGNTSQPPHITTLVYLYTYTWCQIIVYSVYVIVHAMCWYIYFVKQSWISQRTPTENISTAPTKLTANIWLWYRPVHIWSLYVVSELNQ